MGLACATFCCQTPRRLLLYFFVVLCITLQIAFINCVPRNTPPASNGSSLPPTVMKKNCFLWNTHCQDLPQALLGREINESVYVSHYLCSTDECEHNTSAKLIVQPYKSGLYTYKKLRCMAQILERETCNIVLIDSDSRVKDYTQTYDYIECYRPMMSIFYDEGGLWYVFNRTLRRDYYCGGGFIYIPSQFLPKIMSNLLYFEHYKADDVAFTRYFQVLNLPMTGRRDAHPPGCTILGDNREFAVQCRAKDPIW